MTLTLLPPTALMTCQVSPPPPPPSPWHCPLMLSCGLELDPLCNAQHNFQTKMLPSVLECDCGVIIKLVIVTITIIVIIIPKNDNNRDDKHHNINIKQFVNTFKYKGRNKFKSCREGQVQSGAAEGAGLCCGPQGTPGGLDRAPGLPEGSRRHSAVCWCNGAEGVPGQPSHTCVDSLNA